MFIKHCSNTDAKFQHDQFTVLNTEQETEQALIVDPIAVNHFPENFLNPLIFTLLMRLVIGIIQNSIQRRHPKLININPCYSEVTYELAVKLSKFGIKVSMLKTKITKLDNQITTDFSLQ